MKPEIALAFPFMAPIVVNRPGGWESTIPAWLREVAITQRLVLMTKDNEGLATWADVAMYLYTVNMEGPISHNHTMIYFHACLQCFEDAGKEIPTGFEDAETLSSDAEREARDLRHKIFNKQLRRVTAEYRSSEKEQKNSKPPETTPDHKKQVSLDNWIVLEEPKPVQGPEALLAMLLGPNPFEGGM